MRIIFYCNVLLRKRQFVTSYLQDRQSKVEGRACEVGNIQTEKKEKKKSILYVHPRMMIKKWDKVERHHNLIVQHKFYIRGAAPSPPPSALILHVL